MNDGSKATVKAAKASTHYDVSRPLLDHLSTAVILLDQGLCITYMNSSAEQVLAGSSSQYHGTPIQQLIHDEEKSAFGDIENVLKDLRPFTKREAKIHIGSNLQAATVDYTITPITTGSTPSLLLEIRPLDRLKRISREDGIINAHQATRALVRGVAHEVKNPLGGIRGAAQLLARELPDTSLQEYTNIIIAEVERLRNPVDQMLGPRKLPSFSMVNIHEVLERVNSVLSADPGSKVSFDRDYDPSLPELWGDKDQLIQAALNIARNAKQALTESQTPNPTVIFRTRALRQFTIGSTRHRLVILLEIEDNGPGVSEELQETLFYPMVSGRAAGTGLGLSIAQSIINQHHGLVECVSEPGTTTFRLFLPLEQVEQQNNVGA